MSYDNMTLDHLALQVRGHHTAMGKAEAKVEDHAKAAGLYLIECRKRLNLIPKASRTAWATWVTTNCHISKSKSYELIAVAEGRVTAQEITVAKSQSAMRSREAVMEVQKAEAFAAGVAASSTTVDTSGPSVPLRKHQPAKRPINVHNVVDNVDFISKTGMKLDPATVKMRVTMIQALKDGLEKVTSSPQSADRVRMELRTAIRDLRVALDNVEAMLSGAKDMDRAA